MTDPTPPGAPAAAPPPGHAVPASVSSFIGRVHEVEELSARVGPSRLVTLVGPGGAGKTRLAREIAAQRAAAGTAVRWVELAPIRTGADVAAALAAQVDVNAGAGRDLTEALVDAVRGRGYLLVLDNCEHVVDAAAALVDTLLRRAADVVILATSREPLAIEGEFAWLVPPLALPTAAGIAGFDAVRLFVDRATAATPRFALTDANAAAVAAICARLDGLPLAIELAAAMVPVLGVDNLASRLDDAVSFLVRGRRGGGDRHRTLRAVLDWSHELLREEERALLRRLSVFRGAITLDAIAMVCAPPDAEPAHDAGLVAQLGRLVEHSLVEVRDDEGEARYRLLETVRQYGAALLRGTPDEARVRRRHAEWVAREAEASVEAFFSPARGAAVLRFRGAIDEVRAALAWATAPDGDARLAVRITGALGWFWISGISWDEGAAIVDRTLALGAAEGFGDAARPVAERIAYGTCFYPRVGLAYFGGDLPLMLALTARELALWDSVRDTPGLDATQRRTIARGRALTLQLRSLALSISGDVDAARATGDACLATSEASGDRWLHAVMLIRRALMHLYLRDHAAAERDYLAGIPQLRALGEAWFLSLGLEGMASNALLTGDARRAAALAMESVAVLHEERDAWFISRSLDALAWIIAAPHPADSPLFGTEASELAVGWLGMAESLRLRCGAGIIAPDVERHERARDALRARVGEARFTALLEQGRERTLDDLYATLPAAAAQLAIAPVAEAEGAAPASPAPAATGARLAIDVLGPFAMRRDGQPVTTPLPSGKGREILLYLLLHEDAGKDAIGLAIWPDASSAQVKNLFHVALHGLRQQLGPEKWIVFEGGRYRIDPNPAPGVQLDADVRAVLTAAARLRNAARRRESWDDAALDAARHDLARAKGPLGEGTATGDWLVAHQDRVHMAWVEGMESLAQLLRGRQAEAVAVLEELIAREPYRESAHRALMESLSAMGERARALKHYERFVGFLERELGARPSSETRGIAERLGRG